jgi:type I restriction enzyme S subunit
VITDLKPYEAYKESGLPWLRSVPSHWELIPNRGLVRKRKVLVGQRHSDYQLLSLTKQGVIVRDISQGGKFSSDSGTSQEVRKGDLIFCFFDVPETPRTVGLSRHEGMITGAYTVFEFLGTGCPEYFDLFYRAMDDRKLLSPLYSGLRNTIPAERFRTAKTPQPPPSEQGAIVRFLNWANGRLEQAIRAKRKVIALFNEQKQAIVRRAVTRGLDPSVRTKESGISWLGPIPEHWEFRAFARLARVVRGASPRPAGDRRYFYGTHVPWLTVGEVTKDNEVFLERTDSFLTKWGEEKSVRFSSGTLVLTNSGATLGVPKILAVDVCANDGIVAFSKLDPIVDPVFAYYYLSTLTGRLRDELRQGGTQPNLNTGIVRSIVCPLPPKSEQQAILTYLESELSGIRTAISRREREIELLREYRIRLVADVVTGKLDVRAAVARLPEEAAPHVTPDDAELIEETEPAEEEVV